MPALCPTSVSTENSTGRRPNCAMRGMKWPMMDSAARRALW